MKQSQRQTGKIHSKTSSEAKKKEENEIQRNGKNEGKTNANLVVPVGHDEKNEENVWPVPGAGLLARRTYKTTKQTKHRTDDQKEDEAKKVVEASCGSAVWEPYYLSTSSHTRAPRERGANSATR